MKRILRFNAIEADEQIAAFNQRIKELTYNLENLVDYTINWYQHLKDKYGDSYPRHTVIRSFDNIQAATVAEANEKLYINREEGFIGTALKRDENVELVCSCSMIDDVIIFYKDGRYKIVKVQGKLSVGKNVLYVNVFKRNDERTIYNAIYQNGKGAPYYMKRFAVTGVSRDKEYNLTPGKPGTKVMWFTANPNGEAEVVRVTLKADSRLKKLQFDVDFSQLAVKGRGALGNLVTKNPIHRLSLKEHGTSTLGGRQVWFDPDVLRLNYDGRGRLLGEFSGGDLVLVVLSNGEYYTSTFDATNHYEDNILRIEKYRPRTVWTAILNDAEQGYPYLKRFTFEQSSKKQRFLGDNEASTLIALSDRLGARFKVDFEQTEGAVVQREPIVIAAMEFVGVKSFKAKGKRLTVYPVSDVTEVEPIQVEGLDEGDINDESMDNTDNNDIAVCDIEPDRSDDEVRDELTGQQRMF